MKQRKTFNMNLNITKTFPYLLESIFQRVASTNIRKRVNGGKMSHKFMIYMKFKIQIKVTKQ